MSSEKNFTIKTDSFEGPLDLLLSLVEKRKLFINEISLANVADDFVKYIEEKEDFPAEESSDFVLVASTLVLIKSKSLLPKIDLSLEEEESIEDLQDRLQAYEEIKKLVPAISKLVERKQSFTREAYAHIEPIFFPDPAVTLSSIEETAETLLNSLPTKEKKPEVSVEKVISLKEMIERLEKKVQKGLQMKFSEFSGTKKEMTREERVTVIVSFLAMLELVKNGLLQATQEEKFDDINMQTEEFTTPSYT